MSDFVQVQEAELLAARLTMLLPDTMMMLTGGSFLDMLPAVSGVKRGPKKQFDGGYSNSTRYSESEIRENPILALSPEEYRTLRLHMQGLGRREIAGILGITEVGVGLRLQKHRVKAAKARLLDEADEDLSSLVGEALDVYRKGLKASDIEVRMKAADRVFKANGKGAPGQPKQPNDEMTAHKFMSTILQNFEANINVSVNHEPPISLEGNSRGIGYTIDAKDSE
jgi:hypothetical protein